VETLCNRLERHAAAFILIPQRADMVLERCTNAVETPFGVTGL